VRQRPDAETSPQLVTWLRDHAAVRGDLEDALALARRARGLGDTGALRRAATMAFAMLVIAIRRGSKLATAMEARGFGTAPRTWARESRVGPADTVLLVAALLTVAVALGAALAAGTFWAVWS